MREMRSSAIVALSGVLVSLTATLAHAGAEPASPAQLEETKEEAKAPEPPAPPARANAERSGIRALIEQEALKTDLPADVAEAVVFVESSYDASTIGRVGEIGLMQVRPGTAAMLGFTGSTAELAKPEVNIHYGVIYLSQAWRLAGGDLCRALNRLLHKDLLVPILSKLSTAWIWTGPVNEYEKVTELPETLVGATSPASSWLPLRLLMSRRYDPSLQAGASRVSTTVTVPPMYPASPAITTRCSSRRRWCSSAFTAGRRRKAGCRWTA